MAGYTKDFLVDALCHRYKDIQTLEQAISYRKMSEAHYDKVGKDAFRVAASLDAEALRKFKLETGRKS